MSPMPLVFVIHGGGGTGEAEARFSGMDEKAEQAGFIAVYPDGLGRTWNGGSCCGYALDQDMDDVGFFRAMLDDLGHHYWIDSKRVYATGISNGALMAYRLAAELSDRIAAIAAIAAPIGVRIQATRPVPVLHFHGTADDNAPFEGGAGSNSVTKPVHISVRECIRRWVEFNGCPATPVKTALPDLEDDGTSVVREVYGPGRQGSEVVLYIIEGMGHSYPGRPTILDYYLERTKALDIEPDTARVAWYERMGRTTYDISANDIIWDFFQRHPMPKAGQRTEIAAERETGDSR
jgi:polyhydroxybutyrate depolymerase